MNTARDSGKREEQLVHLLQAAPPNSTSGFVSNGSHAALILAHVGLHVGGILRHESYSEDQGVLHVSLTGLVEPHMDFCCFGGLFENWRCATFRKHRCECGFLKWIKGILLFKYGLRSVVELWWSAWTKAMQTRSDHQLWTVRDSHGLLCCHEHKGRRLNGFRKTEVMDLHTREGNFSGLQPDACPIRGIRVRFWVSFPPLLLLATPWPLCKAVACMQALSLPFPSPALPVLLKTALFQHSWKKQTCSLQRPTLLLFSHQ